MKIIQIRPDDYLAIQKLSESTNVAAADIIHNLLKGQVTVAGLTKLLIDTFYNYWYQEHGLKYAVRPKDGQAAKSIGKILAEKLESNDPEFIGSVFEKILISLKGFYYGKELSAISGGFNTIIIEYKHKNQPGIKSNW
jgi:hypothetical protein